MALTPEDIALHRRTLRSLERQADQAARDCQDAAKRLRTAEFAIGAEQAILRAAGEDV